MYCVGLDVQGQALPFSAQSANTPVITRRVRVIHGTLLKPKLSRGTVMVRPWMARINRAMTRFWASALPPAACHLIRWIKWRMRRAGGGLSLPERTLSFPPRRPVFAVLKHNAERLAFVADAVGLCPVFRLAGGVAGGGEGVKASFVIVRRIAGEPSVR